MQFDDNNASLNKDDMQFIDTLVRAIMGIPLENLPEEKRAEVAEKCFSIYENYIYGYFANNFTKKDLIRVKNLDEDSPFEKFPDLQIKFKEAYASFIEFIT